MKQLGDLKLRQRLNCFAEVCKREGLRMTHQRLEVFRGLISAPNHPSAEDIYRTARRRLPTITLDTIYRTIYAFERCQVVRRVQALDDRIRFDTNLNPHHHLICTHCRRIDDFCWPVFDSLEAPSDARDWGEVPSRNVEFRGLCRRCRERVPGGPAD